MHGMDCSLAQSQDAIALNGGNLQVSFHRTIRVPAIDTPFHLPPHLGRFPLYSVKQFDQRLPEHIVSTGGLFFLIHDKEALWIRFTTDRQFAVRICAGGVNVVSGLAANNRSSAPCREKQDYIVTPDQLWIDGFATAPNTARQFVAVASENGYSVEAQLTSEEIVGGFQFQATKAVASVLVTYSVSGCSKTMAVDHQNSVPQFLEHFIKEFGLTDDASSLRLRGIPYNISSLEAGGIRAGRNNSITVEPLMKNAQEPKIITLYIKTLTGKQYTVEVDRNSSIQDLRSIVSESTDLPVKGIRLCLPPRGSLENQCSIANYDIDDKTTIHLTLQLRGRGGGNTLNPPPTPFPLPTNNQTPPLSLTPSPGGKITQPIAKDYYTPTTWDPTTTTSFSVHMLNATAAVEDMLGIRAIPRAIDATTYLERGGVLFYVYGGYEGVKADGDAEVEMEGGATNKYPSCWREYEVLQLHTKPGRGERVFLAVLGEEGLVDVRSG
ncbi:hypothetical protein FQN55_007374 [Onygenales sp. PD_40]|nr:hypothetical protein FQN55_007374 [Onygenales sp. PD_40]